jgi:hypothetical protein
MGDSQDRRVRFTQGFLMWVAGGVGIVLMALVGTVYSGVDKRLEGKADKAELKIVRELLEKQIENENDHSIRIEGLLLQHMRDMGQKRR